MKEGEGGLGGRVGGRVEGRMEWLWLHILYAYVVCVVCIVLYGGDERRFQCT